MKRISLLLRIKLVLSFFLFYNVSFSQAQVSPSQTQIINYDERCTAPLWEKQLEDKLGIVASKDYFEAWVNDKIDDKKHFPSLRTLADEVRTIPVVVHIIHNGEALGQGANIPDSQIYAQIRIMNEDFRRQNADASSTLPEFQPVAVDAHIEFVLAKQDPRGLPTTGINRVKGSQSEYDLSDAGTLSDLSYWDSNDYLNIWVAPLSGINLGYASFPQSDLAGLNFPPSAKETDGVTIDYQYFGEGGNATGSSLGRTATHEVGHFLGLRHIWGDGGCEVDDYVTDTPDQNGSNSSCVTSRTTCESLDMIQNYMDYTPDRCMNLFTQGQLDRIDVVLANSPRRVSLVNGRATQDPEVFALDLALESILAPQNYICTTSISPQVQAFNAGTSLLTSAEIAIEINGTIVQQKVFNFSIEQGGTTQFSFDPIVVEPTGDQFTAKVIRINSSEDQNSTNNTLNSFPEIQPSLSLPYQFSATDFDNLWTLVNEDEAITWAPVNLSLDGQPEDALYLNFYNYEATGAFDYLISPQINLAQYPDAQLVFEMAYAQYPQDGLDDQLTIGISTDCGNTFDLIDPPYQKSGNSLKTSAASSSEFIPTSNSTFRTEVVDLSAYSHLGNVRIAFIAENAFGNNLYIKNIHINTSQSERYTLTIDEWVSPSPVSNGEQVEELLSIKNVGTLSVNSLLLNRTINGTTFPTLLYENLSLEPDNTALLAIPNSTSEGFNAVTVSVLSPNYDQNSTVQSSLNYYLVEDITSIEVPWRENFDEASDLDSWQSINPENNFESWGLVNLQASDNLKAIELTKAVAENTYWFASPIMDLSGLRQASLMFDYAASGLDDQSTFTFLLSQDGGIHFDQELLSINGADMNTIQGSSPVNPNNKEDFQRLFVDLSNYTGEEMDQIRLALVFESSVENSLPIYLDNFEFFLSNNPDPVYPKPGASILYPNPALDLFSLAFNLDSKEDIQIQVISVSGAVVQDISYPNTLNQTYNFSTSLFGSGVYIIKIQGKSIQETKRLIIL